MNGTGPTTFQNIIRKLFLAQLGALVIGVLLTGLGMAVTDQLWSLPFAFLFGCLGGSISLLRRLRRQSDTILAELSSSWISTLTPLLYGGLMAVVAYLLFMSQILTGDGGGGLFTSNLFPRFEGPASPENGTWAVSDVLKIRPVAIQDIGKLLVWSFIAGYSERFVASILDSLENRGRTMR